MTDYRIRIPGYRLHKAGELVPDMRRLSVSERLRQANGKRVRVATTATGTRSLGHQRDHGAAQAAWLANMKMASMKGRNIEARSLPDTYSE